MILDEWAVRWGIPYVAMADLKNRVLNLDGGMPAPAAGKSEASVQAAARAEASRKGLRVFRNNVGAYHDPEAGIYVRFGLANDSPAMNKVVKSADLIGIRPRIIQPSDVGLQIGQFVSYECKHAGWRYTGTEREVAQLAWANLVNGLGGEARFVTNEGQI